MVEGPVISVIHNTKTDRYHPIFFIEAEAPKWAVAVGLAEGARGHKSIGYYNEGFATLEAAVDALPELLAEIVSRGEVGVPDINTRETFSWDGDGNPTVFTFFGVAP